MRATKAHAMRSWGIADLRTMDWRIGLTVMLAGFWLCADVRATEMDSLVDRLPRAYSGEITWDDGQPAQNIAITLEAVRALSEQKAEAIGCAASEEGRETTKFKLRMFIRLSDLQVELWEQSPQGNTRLEAEGSQRGNLSEDLQRIEATGTAGGRGHLLLRAIASAVCAPVVTL